MGPFGEEGGTRGGWNSLHFSETWWGSDGDLVIYYS